MFCPMPSPIVGHNNPHSANEKKICTALAKLIDKGLPSAEKKVWHAHPVWFDDGNPLVGYAVRKSGVQLGSCATNSLQRGRGELLHCSLQCGFAFFPWCSLPPALRSRAVVASLAA